MTDAAPRPRPLVAGNWKMNGLGTSLADVEAIRDRLGVVACDVLICPPATLISRLAAVAAGARLSIGAQDCHAKASGAHTGDIAAEMLRDAGASAVIVGHSERRSDHAETDAIVQAKAVAAHRAGLTAIICVGETIAQRRAGQTLDVVRGQLAGSIPATATAADTVIAYEPVWAIGTGLTPSGDDVVAVHTALRRALQGRVASAASVRLLYGGSVKPSNARDLLSLADVDGALVGGASLKADDFLGIIAAYA